MNKVETFNKFNQGQKRPDRKRHLQLCGFEIVGHINPENGRPSKQALERLDRLSSELGGSYHCVLRQVKNMDGYTFYEVWQKKL